MTSNSNTVPCNITHEGGTGDARSFLEFDLNLTRAERDRRKIHNGAPWEVVEIDSKNEILSAPQAVCFLDKVTSAGYIEGWARDERKKSPCVLQILQDGKVIAEAVADTFRKDLLEAGIGHGHYAFCARIYGAQPGESELGAQDKHSGMAVSVLGERRHSIPKLRRPRPTTVRDILRRRQWTIDDLLNHTACLQLAENLQNMGPERFVDVTCMFLLARWMGEQEAHHMRQLENGEISPEQFFRDLATSNEVAARAGALPGPFEGRFPYNVV